MTALRRPTSFGQFGGLRLDVPIDEVPPTQAIDLLDVDWEGGDGALRPRDGAKKINAAEGSGAYQGLWRHSDTRLLAATALSNVAIGPAGAVEKTGAIAGPVIYASLGTPTASYTFIANFPGEITRYDGSVYTFPKATVDGAGSKAMPVPRYIATWAAGGNRLVFASTPIANTGPGGAVSSNSHIWFSEPGAPESFESTAYVQLSPGDGEEITGLVVWGGMVFAFKRTKFFVFYGVGTNEEGRPVFAFKEYALPSPHFGGSTNGGQRAVAAPDGVYIVCQDGVYVTSGQVPSRVSNALRGLDTPRAIQGPAALTFNTARWQDFNQLFYFRSRLYLVGSVLTLVFDLERREWLLWATALTSLAPWNANSGGPDYLYFASGKNLYRFDPTQTTDPTIAMQPRWQSGFYDLGSEDEKSMVEDKVWGEGEVEIEAFSDLGPTADTGFPVTVKMPAGGGQARSHKTQPSATLFSHKFSLKAGARVQKLTRYMRESRTPTTET